MPATPIVTLDEVKAEINDVSTVNDSELAGFISAVTEVIEERVGPVIIGSFARIYQGSGLVIVLDHAPLVSVDSVMEYSGTTPIALTSQLLGVATVFDGYGYTADLDAGLLYRSSGGYPTRFGANVAVSYTYGRAAVPGSIRMAVLELIRYRWAPQRSAGPSTLGNQPAGPPAGEMIRGIFFPQSVMEMLQPHARGLRVG